MNPLNSIKMHLKGVEKAYGQIVTSETRDKATEIIQGGVSRMGIPAVFVGMPPVVEYGNPVVPQDLPAVAVVATEGYKATTTDSLPVESKETGFPGVSTTVANGVTTVYPHDYEEGERGPGAFSHEIEGDTDKAERDIDPCLAPKVDMIGGWPERGEVEVWGLAPNRRHLRGKLDDGRVVTIERTFGREWKPNEKVTCRLVRAGAACLYRVV